ncbi:unnamed protein product [Microthlaspi erraticum]|uniref:MULE transposase domain-containing protein n=1 Tax=Microthlaspi erraticum TaxID=1685480 RepID=A0A6D2JWP2_9BRAS|nr:unnamed protein product [Microthlaspi erraticum]
MALKACVEGWKHLRKILVVDETHLFGKYRGCLLTTSGQDANFQVFPIAFAVVDSENDLSFSWFFKNLVDIIDDSSELAIISDRSPSIKSEIRKWFPSSHHGTCLTHLTRNVDDHYKRRHQRELVQQTGEAFTVAKFKKYYGMLNAADIPCWRYMEKIEVSQWTRAYFPGNKYNLMSRNIAEALNAALLPARESPIAGLFEFIRRMLCIWFESRRQKIEKMYGDIPEEVD